MNNRPTCFCLSEFEGNPPEKPCQIPQKPCDPSPCGPNTQCTVLSNGFAKCTCLSGYIEGINTIRGCAKQIDPCDPNPCGPGAICDPSRNPSCYCPELTVGNPYRGCEIRDIPIELCKPGPCGQNADCYITNNHEECFCRSGYIGDPYSGCREPPRSPCQPNPCGPGAECFVLPDGRSSCRCPNGMGGDPTSPSGCERYECQVDDDCSNALACIGYRCRDPCPGSCGIGAHCKVDKHHPICFCNDGLSGNPLTICNVIQDIPSSNPCIPSPCGLNTDCIVSNNRAVCSCLPNYLGDPHNGCKPECVLNSDCPSNRACINKKCVNPCSDNTCGLNAECTINYHTASCECPVGYIGNPFYQCIPEPIMHNTTAKPCQSSPCGVDNHCSIYGEDVAICDSCTGPYAWQSPQCRPECLSNADCSFDTACLGQKCVDPCPGSCGYNAHCKVIAHDPVCTCPQGLVGNPYEHCSIPMEEFRETCATVRCGANADCIENNGVLACVCKKGYSGDPLLGCRPECVINPDCPSNKACINNKCTNPCTGACGIQAFCEVVNHYPVCYCAPDHTGDALKHCTPVRTPIPDSNPCDPTPCGANSRCLVSPEGYAICSCLPGYRGNPPLCQPECVISSECPLTKTCMNQKCIDPCPGTCGANALCEVFSHNPVCSCPPFYEGDPFVACQVARDTEPTIEGQPCTPSPCGPNSICQVKQGRPVCSCVANFIGSPPYCRPECTNSNECPQDKACIKEKCVDPCKNVCGSNAQCQVISHAAFCSCLSGYQGDAFIGCAKEQEKASDPCNPSPCGENAQCNVRNGVARCTCIPPYIGDAYSTGCRPECVLNSECPAQLACIKQHCRDPCPGICGSKAECSIVNHIPVCSCVRGYEGDPFTGCRKIDYTEPETDPCKPSPCGPNSLCRVVQGHPTCSCKTGYFGTPPSCRPECVVSSECSPQLSCIGQKCSDPCPGACGENARCEVINHNPICSCPKNYYGDPFVRCVVQRKLKSIVVLMTFVCNIHLLFSFRASKTNKSMFTQSMWSEFSVSRYSWTSSLFMQGWYARCSTKLSPRMCYS